MGLAAIGLIGSVASTGLAIYGQAQQAKAQEAAAKYNNTLAQNEATNQELQTAEAIKRQRQNNRSALADIRTRLSASGVQADTGTPLTVLGEAAGRMEIDIADAARRSAMQAASLRAQGKMGLWEADQAAAAARINMLATGIKGATSAFGMYQEQKYQGINYRIGQ